MKYMVGYQMQKGNDFIDEIIDQKEHIYEVYFSWGDFANGRNNQLQSSNFTPWQAQQRQIEDLKALSQNGVKLNLLFNATCYGSNSQSRVFLIRLVRQLITYQIILDCNL